MIEQPMWWQSGVVYQIYPRSFQDSNGDGIGDLAGITQRLDYLQELGIDAIWISPIYPSPMADFGYDVADYTGVDPIFGTLEDFEIMLENAHARGLRVILDLVPNHSSDEHPWFVQSRSSRDNPHRDWYIWRDPAPDGGPPNNWISNFGSPAWTFDESTGQYYLHLFEPKQPDLNWRNPAVREAIYNAMRFWLERGVDGFRVDVIWMLIKHPDFPDNPPNPKYQPGQPEQWKFLRVYDQNQPEVHDVIREMRGVIEEFPARLLIGEIYMEPEGLATYYGPQLDELHLPFNFNLVTLEEWHSHSVGEMITRYEAALPPGGWPNWVLGNHDQPRIASRVGAAQARLANLLLLTLRGTPTMYYGDEIGMTDVPIPQAMVVDPQGLRTPGFSRDPERTPMQWNNSPNAGFSSARPWLPVAADLSEHTVAAQEHDPHSLLNLVKQLLKLRHTHQALAVGDYTPVAVSDPQGLAYLRSHGDEQMLVALNFDTDPIEVDLSAAGPEGEILAATHPNRQGTLELGQLTLQPAEGILVKVKGKG